MTNDTTEVINWIHLFPVESCMGAEWGYDQLWVWSKIYQYFRQLTPASSVKLTVVNKEL